MRLSFKNPAAFAGAEAREAGHYFCLVRLPSLALRPGKPDADFGDVFVSVVAKTYVVSGFSRTKIKL
jgi:hypothetical protein